MLDSKQIRALRLFRGWSLAELAVRLKVTEAAVRRWEKDERHPRWEQAKVLSALWEEAKREGMLQEVA